jgi:hypothetical protein
MLVGMVLPELYSRNGTKPYRSDWECHTTGQYYSHRQARQYHKIGISLDSRRAAHLGRTDHPLLSALVDKVLTVSTEVGGVVGTHGTLATVPHRVHRSILYIVPYIDPYMVSY